MAFDKLNDKIAVTVPFFELLRSQDGVRPSNLHANEPYLLTLAVDSHGKHDPGIAFNATPFPNARRGEKVAMLGDGHLVYGPANPGEFVAVSVLLMESDNEFRMLGDRIEGVVTNSAARSSIKSLMTSGAGAAALATGLTLVADFVIRLLKDNKDDEVLRTAGTFFRDRPVPYDINRQFLRANAEAGIALRVLPLDVPNGQGPETRRVRL